MDSDCIPDLLEQDLDSDGQLPCQGDCDDSDALMHGMDQDFDGVSPCGPDGDASTLADGDCNDADVSIYPGAAELCDGIDSNCEVDGAELERLVAEKAVVSTFAAA